MTDTGHSRYEPAVLHPLARLRLRRAGVKDVRLTPNRAMVTLEGPIDSQQSDALSALLRQWGQEHGPREVVLDLTAVKSLTTEGAGFFFTALYALRRSDGRLTVRGANRQVAATITRLGLAPLT
ncbi:STAS domain-containing protein [Streptomyces sp. NBRC 110611]|uniref:STAS domain-containing protein n=1 Tax=Streptomyces sp. NBRC 110611 TaxID=1621259 RepID=UPI000A497758|nr:STAS domain-containing protein [Streptomyces sp. NBRC 110611]